MRNAAELANRDANRYLQEFNDFRSQVTDPFQAGVWSSDTGPFVLEIQSVHRAWFDTEDMDEMRRIAKKAVATTLRHDPDMFGALIASYAREGLDFFDEFKM